MIPLPMPVKTDITVDYPDGFHYMRVALENNHFAIAVELEPCMDFLTEKNQIRLLTTRCLKKYWRFLGAA